MATAEKQRATSVPKQKVASGFVAPVVGRVAVRDVPAHHGFLLIRKGETITEQHMDRADRMGRLYELIASTEG